MARARALGPGAAIVVANPLPRAEQVDPALHDRRAAESSPPRRRGVRGKASTPFLLDRLHRATAARRSANVRSCGATPRSPRGSRGAAPE